MAMSKIKVHEIAKELNVTSKEVIERLAECGIEVKSHSSTLEEEHLGIIFDIFTKLYEASEEDIKKEEIKEEPKPAEKEAEKKPEAVIKQEVKPVKKEETEKKEKKKEEKKQPKAEQKPQPKKKKEQEIQIPAEEPKEEDFVIKADKSVRYVDTRTSTVEIETIETRERLEDMVTDKMRDMRGGRNSRKKKNQRRDESKIMNQEQTKKAEPKKEAPKIIEIPETITVGDFAKAMGKTAAEVVKKLMMLGVMATVTQNIDFDTATLIADDFGIELKKEIVITKEDILFSEEEDKPEDLKPRPPVVVVMGHVDHGKTSLLDAIRHTSVISTEAGGITQHIGAYSVRLNDRDITFLDTPGHEAFTTMRARGAQVTDIAILVVAADDGIMPQTVEAINHAKAAGVSIVVAINKIDKEGANAERVKQMLVEYDLVPEEWGGDTVCVEVSAKKNINIDGLLEMVLLIADMQELKANPNKPAKGAVIEAQIDKGRGPVATVLVQEGTLKVGDIVIAGTAVGHVRAMVNDKGRRVKTAGPSTPVEILGLSELPSGGDIFRVVADEKMARDVAEARKQEQKETRFNSAVKVSLDNLFSQIDEGNMKE